MTLQEALQAIDQGEGRLSETSGARTYRRGAWTVRIGSDYFMSIEYRPQKNYSQTASDLADFPTLVSAARSMKASGLTFYRALLDSLMPMETP